jgi:hypothetical protein
MADLEKPLEPNASFKLLNPDLSITPQFYEWIVAVSRGANGPTIFGTGSPEGSVNGAPGRQYVNTSAPQGQRLWIKQMGDEATGWIQV